MAMLNVASTITGPRRHRAGTEIACGSDSRARRADQRVPRSRASRREFPRCYPPRALHRLRTADCGQTIAYPIDAITSCFLPRSWAILPGSTQPSWIDICAANSHSTSVQAGRDGVLIRSAGPEKLMTAMTREATSRTGAATPKRPFSRSHWSIAYPCARIFANSRRNSSAEVIGGRRESGQWPREDPVDQLAFRMRQQHLSRCRAVKRRARAWPGEKSQLIARNAALDEHHFIAMQHRQTRHFARDFRETL